MDPLRVYRSDSCPIERDSYKSGLESSPVEENSRGKSVRKPSKWFKSNPSLFRLIIEVNVSRLPTLEARL